MYYGQLNNQDFQDTVPPEARADAVTLQRSLCLYIFDSSLFPYVRSGPPTSTLQGRIDRFEK